MGTRRPAALAVAAVACLSALALMPAKAAAQLSQAREGGEAKQTSESSSEGPLGTRLESAADRSDALQTRLDQLGDELADVRTKAAQADQRLARLKERRAQAREEAAAAKQRAARRARKAYKRGGSGPLLTLFSGPQPSKAQRRARVLGHLSETSRQVATQAAASARRADDLAEQVRETADQLAARRAELRQTENELSVALAEAEQTQAKLARRAQRQQARTSRSRRRGDAAGSASAPARTAGGVSCPVGAPRTYSDTYGAARSGGRSHKGTDILASRGTPVFAYEDGVVDRLSRNGLGGITLYLEGDSGRRYYYAHLNSYAPGLTSGQRVSAGQRIAAIGDTGNAEGIPHLHLEVTTTSGATTNPYPYVRRACG
jgi:murein DD-endopeptidase MepM/ murein hydrolase activator NlpD